MKKDAESSTRNHGLGISADLTPKERALRSVGLVIRDANGSTVFEERRWSSLHFFPLSIADYAEALCNHVHNGTGIPILSVDSHDVLACDFACDGCLSRCGKGFPVRHFPNNAFHLDAETYMTILADICAFSARRGFTGVKFEQSGEGNPDLYPYREDILAYAKRIGMRSMYVTTGSKLRHSLLEELACKAEYVRISFPGIGDAYQHYSRQDSFTYEDAFARISQLVHARAATRRDRELIIGARVALRQRHDARYIEFASRLKDSGVDCVQIVKTVIPDTCVDSEHCISPRDRRDIENCATLDGSTFNVTVPNLLDSIYYSRRIAVREEFPSQCLAARLHPVLMGRCVMPCTHSSIAYDPAYMLGSFSSVGDIERFMSAETIARVTHDLPTRCTSCCDIFDNILFHDLLRVFLKHKGALTFHDVNR